MNFRYQQYVKKTLTKAQRKAFKNVICKQCLNTTMDKGEDWKRKGKMK